MDRCETNIDSIRALEKQIIEYERTIINLKRTRNSLLNVSKLPPEVLGNVFRWNVIREGDFGGLDPGSHNFLAVCHHWFEVASRTPEVWSSWGNTPKDWARWYCHSGSAPLDLVLNWDHYNTNDGDDDDDDDDDENDDDDDDDENDKDEDRDGLDPDLRDAINGRATKDTIRRVHLKAKFPMLIDVVTAELTAKGEGLRSNSMESLVLWNVDNTRPVDVSDFLAHYRFPKLQRLELTNCTISSWDRLTSRTSFLTTLKLDFADPSYIQTPTPTTSQLFSILASNPTLQRVALLSCAIPNDGGGESSRVRLCYLKELHLGGDFQHVLRLINQLDHPRNMDSLTLTLDDCGIADISRTIGPYLRDHLQRRDRPQGGLNLLVSSWNTNYTPHITFHAGDARGVDFSAPSLAEIKTFVKVDVVLSGAPRKDVLEKVALDLTTYAPREEVVHFRMYNQLATRLGTYTQFPNLKALSFDDMYLPAAFPNQILIGEGKISPSLKHVFLEDMVVDDADWSPLVTFLAHCVSSGNRLDTLVIVRSPHMCSDVTESIRGMVRELRIEDQGRRNSYRRRCCI